MAIENWTDKDYAQAAIDMLPDTVEEIAKLMRVHKIMGQQARAFRCPIALWVQKWTGNENSGVYSAYTWPNKGQAMIKNPPVVAEFIHAFDAGRIKL